MIKKCISPPWYILRNKIYHTIGNNPSIQVSELITISKCTYKINIYCLDYPLANAIRTILPPTYNFGGTIIYIYVYKSQNLLIPVNNNNKIYTPQDIGSLFKIALSSNNLFDKILFPPKTILIIMNVVIVMKKAVIQFYDDDISDFYQNFNEVASKVFSDIVILNFPENVHVSFTTESSV